MVRATGFSQNPGTPASVAATMSSGWASVAAATTTPSTPEARSCSGGSTASAPYFSTTEWRASGTASVTTREVTDDSEDSVSAWKAPTRPSPTKPILTAAPMGQGGGSIRAADDGLVPVDDRTGDDAAAVRQEEDDEIGDLVDLTQLAHGHGRGGLRTPVLAGAVEFPLGGVLTLRVGPADVEAVDADAVPAVGVRSVARRPGEPRLGRHVGGEVRLTAELGDRDDVDHRPGRIAPDHVADDGLHREVRAAQVHGDVCVEQLGRRVDERAAGGQARRVDQAVDATELGDGGLNGRPRLRDVADVGLHEARGPVLLGQLGDELFPGLATTAGDDDRLGAFAYGRAGDRRAQSLTSTADEHDLAFEQGQHWSSSAVTPAVCRAMGAVDPGVCRRWAAPRGWTGPK